MNHAYGAAIILFIIIAIVAFSLAAEWKKDKKDNDG
jgi:hypothetical protein